LVALIEAALWPVPPAPLIRYVVGVVVSYGRRRSRRIAKGEV
jgi:hypothetical protein